MYNKTNTHNEKGFTMIELIIVVAIMGIIGAVLVPTFSTMTAKARLTSDVTTVKTLQRQIDIYEAEFGTFPGTKPTGTTGDAAKLQADTVTKLIEVNYMDTKYINTTTSMPTLQTSPSGIYYNGQHFYLGVNSDDLNKLNDGDPNKDVWIDTTP